MLYVAYGSNLNKEQMKKRCPKATIAGKGTAPDHDLVFNTVATLHERENAHTPVALWNMSDDDEKTMDVYEGFPHKYHKEQITVQLDNGKTVIGVAYIMNDRKHQAIPNDEYYNRIERGYRDFGFSLDKLEDAYDRSVEYEVNHRQMSFWDLPATTIQNSTKVVEDDGYCVFGKGITNEDCDLLYRGFIVGKRCALYGIEPFGDEIKELVKELSKTYDSMYYKDLDFETFVDECLSEENSMYLYDDYEQEQELLRKEPPTARYYAAYGSNMNKEQMAYRCPNSTEEQVGYAVDCKLEFCSYANIVPERNALTPVLLWKIDPRDWEQLDQYEGYPTLYRREEIDVDVNGEQVKAVAYIMNDCHRNLSMPGTYYLENMLHDYKRLGLDPTPIAAAMEDVMQARSQAVKSEKQQVSFYDTAYDVAAAEKTLKNIKKTKAQGIKV